MLPWQTCKDLHRLKILMNNYFFFLKYKSLYSTSSQILVVRI